MVGRMPANGSKPAMGRSAAQAVVPMRKGLSQQMRKPITLPVTEHALKNARSSDHERITENSYRISVD